MPLNICSHFNCVTMAFSWWGWTFAEHAFYESLGDRTLTHLWWSCPLIMQFWASVNTLYNKVCVERVWRSPDLAFLCFLAPYPWQIKAFWDFLSRQSAKSYWDTRKPFKAKWLNTILEFCRMKELLTHGSHRSDQFSVVAVIPTYNLKKNIYF